MISTDSKTIVAMQEDINDAVRILREFGDSHVLPRIDIENRACRINFDAVSDPDIAEWSEWLNQRFRGIGATTPSLQNPSRAVRPYPQTSKQDLTSEIDQFPAESHLQTLAALLRPGELREILTGLVTDVCEACRREDVLLIAEEINSWVATAEETVEYRRKRRHIDRELELMKKGNIG